MGSSQAAIRSTARLVPAVLCLLFALAFIAAASACSSGTRTTDQPVGGATATSSAGGADLLAVVKRRGKLLIATDAKYEPQSYRTADGVWHGFDVDVGREIARRIGVQPQYLDISFDVITGGHWSGRWDVDVGSMSITHDRQRVLYLSDPYYYVPASFVVNRDSKAASINDLTGKRVGVGTATTYQAYLENHLSLIGEKILRPPPQTRVVPYDTDLLALQDLALGDGVRLDAVLTALPFAMYQIRSGQAYKVLDKPVFYDASAVAIDKSSPNDPASLFAAVQSAIRGMHKDGMLSALSKKYYGIDLSRKQ
ncbi:MAG: cysteine ABC transporter substrate-binding protein [Candidatus Eremiobacter antarcticus]|nr:transporter substrate-binding domain-containing protein [Candidatus Eremiobacteraeota bacterium]MBC5807492.1 transporter substrate-binding domain-containing protein [Candidatus Eremiobacteraeota bacterium]PZR61451.1 MAG: cysteine ABC transporter substrate-binding protein [Candidatus Eremiobacter sp. RRmetagenome_bin22]